MVKQYSNFVFTLNNYSDESVNCLKNVFLTGERMKYLIFGREVGEEKKTPHLQGYAELKKRMTLNSIQKNIFDGKKIHIEKRRGSATQAADYCKKDGDFEEFGEISNPGKRTDLEALKADIDGGMSIAELWEEHHGTMSRYYKSQRVYMMRTRAPPVWKKVTVNVYWGDAGVGKTRRAYEEDPDLFRVINDGKWWDGYIGQKTILFDEFYGNMKYGTLLRYLDGYREMLPIKGGFTWKNWDTVIITSNKPPEEWYRMGMTDALKRRISVVRVLSASSREGNSGPP